MPVTKKTIDMIKFNVKVILVFVLNRISSSALTSLFGWLIGPVIIIMVTDIVYSKYEIIGATVKFFTINSATASVVHDRRRHDK